MDSLRNKLNNNRTFRHGLFWLFWIAGFTFIKSFGETIDTYFAWLAYYIVTLPVFMAHTYIIVYWAARRFGKGVRIVLFCLLFLLFMLFFSFLELVITEELLSQLFPKVFTDNNSYLNPGDIVISGIGNLYILLVFVAARMIREWDVSQKRRKEILEKNLYIERADVNAGIQPGMLLYSMEKIEQLAVRGEGQVPEAISLLSELLNGVMRAAKSNTHRVDEEVKTVKRMLKLYALLAGVPIPRLRIGSDKISGEQISAFILFSPMEILVRKYGVDCVSNTVIDFKDQRSVELIWEGGCSKPGMINPDLVEAEMTSLYPGRFKVESVGTDKGESMRIRELETPLTDS